MLQNAFMLLVERLEWAVCEKNRKKKAEFVKNMAFEIWHF